MGRDGFYNNSARRSGGDRSFTMYSPRLSLQSELALMAQIKKVREVLGDEGAVKFIRDTEAKLNLPECQLDCLLEFMNIPAAPVKGGA